jgi:hypothetical protein
MKRLLVIAAILALSSLQGAASSAGKTTWSPVTLKIEQTWLRRSVDGAQRTTGNSLGTAVGPNLILTHGHFHVPPQSPRSIAFKVIGSTGQVIQYRSDEVQQIILSRETTFIYLPSAMTGSSAPLADRDTLDRLQPGAWVTLNYWDDAQERGAQRLFQIVQVQQAVVTLADPDRVINVGDSGGGVFFADKLIGVTSSIDVDAQDRSVGRVNVTLVTPDVRNLVQQYKALMP